MCRDRWRLKRSKGVLFNYKFLTIVFTDNKKFVYTYVRSIYLINRSSRISYFLYLLLKKIYGIGWIYEINEAIIKTIVNQSPFVWTKARERKKNWALRSRNILINKSFFPSKELLFEGQFS